MNFSVTTAHNSPHILASSPIERTSLPHLPVHRLHSNIYSIPCCRMLPLPAHHNLLIVNTYCTPASHSIRPCYRIEPFPLGNLSPILAYQSHILHSTCYPVTKPRSVLSPVDMSSKGLALLSPRTRSERNLGPAIAIVAIRTAPQKSTTHRISQKMPPSPRDNKQLGGSLFFCVATGAYFLCAICWCGFVAALVGYLVILGVADMQRMRIASRQSTPDTYSHMQERSA